jgi:hypothetical protein
VIFLFICCLTKNMIINAKNNNSPIYFNDPLTQKCFIS